MRVRGKLRSGRVAEKQGIQGLYPVTGIEELAAKDRSDLARSDDGRKQPCQQDRSVGTRCSSHSRNADVP
jgi:hypothetical protein